MKKIFFLICLLTAIIACHNNQKSQSSTPKDFPFPSVPSVITSEAEVYQYIAIHYWDKYFDSVEVFSQDTSLIGGVTKGDFINAYRGYVDILMRIPTNIAFTAQKKAVDLAEKAQLNNPNSNVFQSFIKFAEEAIYGVNSDYRNEELYIPVLEKIIQTTLIDSLSKISYKMDLEGCYRNRIGEKGANFKYMTTNGEGTLYLITSEHTLLFFSNPGCPSCKEIMTALDQSATIKELINSKKLTVLNLYIDENITEWHNYIKEYPKGWINGYDPDLIIRNDNLYNIRAIPSMYLMDRDKKILLKDAPVEIILNVLENLGTIN